MKKNFKHPGSAVAMAAACMFLAFAQAHAQDITHLYTLGDSLSDAGTYAPSTALAVPGSGRFTTNPGLVWAQYLGQSLGLPSEPAIANHRGAATRTPNGGTNYAQGGARVSKAAGTGMGAWYTADPVSTQVDRLLAATGGRIDGKALVTVWAGANDVYTQLGAVGRGLAVPVAISSVGASAAELAGQVRRLQAAGAKLVIVNTLPDSGRTPLGLSQGASGAALLTAMSEAFNQQLLQATAGSNVLVFDSNKVLDDVLSRPAAYGFTAVDAVTRPVCLPAGSLSLTCVEPAGADTSVFADAIHPTAAAHRVFAQIALSQLRAPGQVATMAVAPLVALRQHMVSLESRLTTGALLAAGQTSGGVALRPQGHLEMYASAETGRFSGSRRGVLQGNDSSTAVAFAGGDLMVTPNALAGLVLAHSMGDLSFSEKSGGFKARLTLAGTYVTAALSPNWYVNAVLAAGDLGFDNVHRDTHVGASQLLLSAKGETSGNFTLARAGGGYVMASGAFSGGPSLSFTQEKVTVKGYTEQPGVLAMSFGDTHYRARRISLAFGGQYDLGRLKPLARLSLEKDLDKDPLRVMLGTSAGNAMAVDGDRPDGQFVLATVGLMGELPRRMQWTVLRSSTMSQANIKGWSVGAALQIPF